MYSCSYKIFNKYICHICILSSMIKATFPQSVMRGNLTLFDFTTCKNVDDWMEISDTVRKVGMSKAVLTLQKTQVFQQAIFFTLLKPQPNGAGFAGVRTPTNWNLTGYRNIILTCRSHGSNKNYKVVMRHNGESSDEKKTYEYFFTVPLSDGRTSSITCPLSDFKAYYRGCEVPMALPLNIANITMFGLQVYGGVYLEMKQKGVSALEIDTISAEA